MADQKSRGGKKQQNEKQELGKKQQGTQADAGQKGQAGTQRNQGSQTGRKGANR